MSNKSTVWTSLLTAIGSAAIIFFRASLGNAEVAKNLAYYAIPFGFAVFLAVRNLDTAKSALRMSLGLGVYGVAMTLLEPLSLRFWVTYQTPLGGTYNRYSLAGLYPAQGFIILALIFIATIALLVGWTAIRKTARAVDRRVQSIGIRS